MIFSKLIMFLKLYFLINQLTSVHNESYLLLFNTENYLELRRTCIVVEIETQEREREREREKGNKTGERERKRKEEWDHIAIIVTVARCSKEAPVAPRCGKLENIRQNGVNFYTNYSCKKAFIKPPNPFCYNYSVQQE